LIFDEWAAEQDPEFREYFYHKLLPDLRQAGKTLLVATHDDRFFDVADAIVKLELGRVQSIHRKGQP
jgi:putative ATP-binding cassette transporter